MIKYLLLATLIGCIGPCDEELINVYLHYDYLSPSSVPENRYKITEYRTLAECEAHIEDDGKPNYCRSELVMGCP